MKNLRFSVSVVILILVLASGFGFTRLVGVAGQVVQGPISGGTFIDVTGNPPHLDPGLTTDTPAIKISAYIFNDLIELDMNMKLVPNLATSWQGSSDGKTWTFNLARNVTWQDGKPFTADDVKFTFEKILKPYHPRSVGYLKNFDHIETPDNYTAVFRMTAPTPGFDGLLVTFLSYIQPRHYYEQCLSDIYHCAVNEKPMGSGPFMFKEWVKGDHVTLVRNPNYWKLDNLGNKLPYLDTVIVKLVADPATRVLGFDKGEIDFLDGYMAPSSEVPRWQKTSGVSVNFDGLKAMGASVALFLNNGRAPTNNVQVRRAMSYAINKSYILDKVMYGYGYVLTTSFPKETFPTWFNPKYQNDPYPYNPTLANTMLDQAGFPKGSDGKRFSIQIGTDFSWDFTAKAGEVIRDQLKAVGIDVNLFVLDSPAFIQRVFGNWDFDGYIQLYALGPEPRLGVDRLWVSTNIKKGAPYNNAHQYNNSRVTQLFDMVGSEVDPEKRKADYYEIQDIIAQDAPAVFLFAQHNPFVYRSTLHNAIQTPYANYDTKATLWSEKGTTYVGPKTATTTQVATSATTSVAPTSTPVTSLAAALAIIVVVCAAIAVIIQRRKKKTG